MKLKWGSADQIKFANKHDYYKALGIFSNSELVTITREDNAKRGSYTDADRIRLLTKTRQIKTLPKSIKRAVKSEGRINCNDYAQNLIDNHGFVLSGKNISATFQDVFKTVPADCVKDFLAGYYIAKNKAQSSKKVCYYTDNIDVSTKELKIKDIPNKKSSKSKTKARKKKSIKKRDYIQETIDNIEIGMAGERIVYEYERKKLQQAKDNGLLKDPKNKLDWVSIDDDSAGYDIKSYDPKTRKNMFIEVKTTTGNGTTPFFMTENEIKASKRLKGNYYVYRLYKLNKNEKTKTVQCFIINGDVTKNKKIRIKSNGYYIEVQYK